MAVGPRPGTSPSTTRREEIGAHRGRAAKVTTLIEERRRADPREQAAGRVSLHQRYPLPRLRLQPPRAHLGPLSRVPPAPGPLRLARRTADRPVRARDDWSR